MVMKFSKGRYTLILQLLAFSLSIAFAKTSCSTEISSSERYAALVMNYTNGEIIYSKSAYAKRHPASLAKMMTLYLLFDAIQDKKIEMSQSIIISQYAASQPRSNMNLKSGTKMPLNTAINAIIVKSANDVAVAIAESVAGSEAAFVKMMNAKAKALKMYNTNFMNSNGWHDPNQYTTAFDMAKLAAALRKNHKQYYHLFSKTSFTFKGKIIRGHNRVLTRYKWADGLKTGFVNASGFNIVTSTKRPEGNLITVVMGGQTQKIRDDHTIKLINYAYDQINKKNLKNYDLIQTTSDNSIQNSIFQAVENEHNENKKQHYVSKKNQIKDEMHKKIKVKKIGKKKIAGKNSKSKKSSSALAVQHYASRK